MKVYELKGKAFDTEDADFLEVVSLSQEEIWDKILKYESRFYRPALYKPKEEEIYVRPFEKELNLDLNLSDYYEATDFGSPVPKCPVCGHEFQDAWDYECEEEETCVCGAELRITREFIYDTEVKKMPEVIEIDKL
jgi:hypothetical protein